MTLLTPAIVWLGLMILLLVIEIVTLGLTTVWFAGGALAAFIAACLGASVIVQLIIFVVLSLALLVITRPMAMRYMQKGHEKTNVESLIGRAAVVTKEINNLAQSGEVILSDVSWTARCVDDACIISAGSKVRICAIEGVKLMVEEIKEEN